MHDMIDQAPDATDAKSANDRRSRFSQRLIDILGKILVTILVLALSLWLAMIVFGGLTIWWPPEWLEHRRQRAAMMARVQAAGGWDAVRRDCLALARQNTNGFYSHPMLTTNGLPPALIKLGARYVQYYPAAGLVDIQIFGIHSTGGHSIPYFGLAVVTSGNIERDRPRPSGPGRIGRDYHNATIKPVAEGIYEIY